jgi:hypothetical protein
MINKLVQINDEYNTQVVKFKTKNTKWNGFFNSKMCKLQTEHITSNKIGRNRTNSVVIFYLYELDKTVLSIGYKKETNETKIYNKEGNHTQDMYRIIKDNEATPLSAISDLLVNYMLVLK